MSSLLYFSRKLHIENYCKIFLKIILSDLVDHKYYKYQ